MKEKSKKLSLNQETLVNLTKNDPTFFATTSAHTCVSVCTLPCTPKAAIN
jgi:hypothetical protein